MKRGEHYTHIIYNNVPFTHTHILHTHKYIYILYIQYITVNKWIYMKVHISDGSLGEVSKWLITYNITAVGMKELLKLSILKIFLVHYNLATVLKNKLMCCFR